MLGTAAEPVAAFGALAATPGVTTATYEATAVTFGVVRWAGVAAGLVAAVLVYADAARRGLARPVALALLVGSVAAGGFLAPSLLYEAVYRGLGPDGTVERAPDALFAGMLLTGAAMATGAVLTYGLAARLRDAADRR